MRTSIRKVLTGAAATAAVATGLSAGISAPAAHADPPPQRPLGAKTLLHAKDVRQVFPRYTSIKSKAGTTAGKNHLSACTGNDNLKDILPVTTTWYGSLRQVVDDRIQFTTTQQAAHDGETDGDATDAYNTLTSILDDCFGQMIDGLIYKPGQEVSTDFYQHAMYFPKTDDDGNLLGATIVATNQDHVNVLEVYSSRRMTEDDLVDITKLAVKRAR